MFNKLKQLKDLRDQAKKMQEMLSAENITIDKRGVKLIMNGNMEIKSLQIDKSLSHETIEKIVTDNTNEAIKETQKMMAKKMQEMGGFMGLGGNN